MTRFIIAAAIAAVAWPAVAQDVVGPPVQQPGVTGQLPPGVLSPVQPRSEAPGLPGVYEGSGLETTGSTEGAVTIGDGGVTTDRPDLAGPESRAIPCPGGPDQSACSAEPDVGGTGIE